MSTQQAGSALLSVYNKEGIADFATGLSELGWKIYASGGTAKIIEKAGVEVIDVSELIGGDAILGHRVVTLSREIFAGLLADKSKPEDIKEMETLGIPTIDLVCVDMYPMEEAIAHPQSTTESVIEQTDIGGPTLIRAAAKGKRIVLSVANQRNEVLEWLRNDSPDEEEFLADLAARAEYEVTRYTMALARYRAGDNVAGRFAWLDQPTKYGENPQQFPAGLYADNRVEADPLGLENFTQLKGFDRSYINMTDIDRLLQTITHIAAGFDTNYQKVPFIAVGVKHGNACGAGVADNLDDAVKKMLEGDTRAIFGGVVMVNGEIETDIATTLMKHAMDGDATRLLDAVIAPIVTEDAVEILSRKKLRVIVNPALSKLDATTLDASRLIRPVRGGVLAQPNYLFILDYSDEELVSKGDISPSQKKDMLLAWAVGNTSNSNTITLVKDGKLIGNGVGQQDRVGAGQLALSRTTTELLKISTGEQVVTIEIKLDAQKIKGATAYSDSFFPFADGPLVLAEAGIGAILSSSGSIRDTEVTQKLADKGVSTLLVPDKKARGFYAH